MSRQRYRGLFRGGKPASGVRAACVIGTRVCQRCGLLCFQRERLEDGMTTGENGRGHTKVSFPSKLHAESAIDMVMVEARQALFPRLEHRVRRAILLIMSLCSTLKPMLGVRMKHRDTSG